MALAAMLITPGDLDALAAHASVMVGEWRCSAFGPRGPSRVEVEALLADQQWAIVAARDGADLLGFLVVRKRDAKTVWMVVVRERAAEVIGFLAAQVKAQTGRGVWGIVGMPKVREAMLSIPGMVDAGHDVIRYEGP